MGLEKLICVHCKANLNFRVNTLNARSFRMMNVEHEFDVVYIYVCTYTRTRTAKNVEGDLQQNQNFMSKFWSPISRKSSLEKVNERNGGPELQSLNLEV